MLAVTHDAEGGTQMLKTISTAERAERTREQIERVDEQLIDEFPSLPADVVHDEVATVSKGLLASAHFTDHVAVLTGRFAADHLKDIEASLVHSSGVPR
jgi:hypothetical protein